MKKIIIPSLLIFFFIFLVAGAFFFFCYYRALPVTYTAEAYPESGEALENPYRGFYRIYAYRLTGEMPNEEELSASVSNAPGNLVLLEFNLRDWQNKAMSEAALSQLDSILSHWAASGKQLILRFLYDWDGNAEETEPTNLSQIQTHLKQAAGICNRYVPHIFLIQGLCTGNYGEMHHSHHQSAEAITSLATTLNDFADPSIFLAVRTPDQWRTISEQSSGKLDNRLGLFNDGLLASSSDAGTYGDTERSAEIAFQNTLCETVPNGGEVIIPNEYNDLENAISDFSQMHISYLNMDYDPEVLEKWKNSSYTGEGVFSGCDGLHYMDTHLGYRYVLRDSSFSFEPLNSFAKLSITIENVGFSANYIPFRHEIILLSKDSDARYAFTAECPTLQAGETTTLSCNLPVRNIDFGSYDVYIKTTDERLQQPILYGNDLSPASDGYFLGTLTFEKKSVMKFTDYLSSIF